MKYSCFNENSAQNIHHKQSCETNNIPHRNKEGPKSQATKSQQTEKSDCKSQKSSNPIGNLLSGLFSDGKIDNDRVIIIILIIILAKNGADLKLLIALGYILM